MIYLFVMLLLFAIFSATVGIMLEIHSMTFFSGWLFALSMRICEEVGRTNR